MRAVFGLVLVVGLGLAGFAVYMVQGYLNEQQAALARRTGGSAAQQMPTVEVYAVNRAIGYGEVLTPEDVRWSATPSRSCRRASSAPRRSCSRRAPTCRASSPAPMQPNEPVLASRSPSRAAAPASRPASPRACAPSRSGRRHHRRLGLPAPRRPGRRLLDRHAAGSQRHRRRCDQADRDRARADRGRPVLRHRPVRGRIARTVTVQVSPQQVAQLAQAQATGTLSLSLVGMQDETMASAIEVDQRSLLGIAEAAPVIVEQAPAPEVCTIRTRRGAEVVDIPIPCTLSRRFRRHELRAVPDRRAARLRSPTT